MSQNLSARSHRDFLFYVILTISYLQARTIRRHRYLPIPHSPCSSKSRFFLAYWLYYILTVSTFLNIYARVTRMPPRDFAFWVKMFLMKRQSFTAYKRQNPPPDCGNGEKRIEQEKSVVWGREWKRESLLASLPPPPPGPHLSLSLFRNFSCSLTSSHSPLSKHRFIFIIRRPS